MHEPATQWRRTDVKTAIMGEEPNGGAGLFPQTWPVISLSAQKRTGGR